MELHGIAGLRAWSCGVPISPRLGAGVPPASGIPRSHRGVRSHPAGSRGSPAAARPSPAPTRPCHRAKGPPVGPRPRGAFGRRLPGGRREGGPSSGARIPRKPDSVGAERGVTAGGFRGAQPCTRGSAAGAAPRTPRAAGAQTGHKGAWLGAHGALVLVLTPASSFPRGSEPCSGCSRCGGATTTALPCSTARARASGGVRLA